MSKTKLMFLISTLAAVVSLCSAQKPLLPESEATPTQAGTVAAPSPEKAPGRQATPPASAKDAIEAHMTKVPTVKVMTPAQCSAWESACKALCYQTYHTCLQTCDTPLFCHTQYNQCVSRCINNPPAGCPR